MTVVIDASVWVSAADQTDGLCQQSRSFLRALAEPGHQIVVPGIARVEIACALARRLRDAAAARSITTAMLAAPTLKELDVSRELLSTALEFGTKAFLRGADAIYTAAASKGGASLISWDAELVQRSGAMTPAQWLSMRVSGVGAEEQPEQEV